MTLRFGGRGAAALLVFVCAFGSRIALAQTPIVLPAGDAPVIRIMMRTGTLTVRTWNRSDVQVSSAQPALARSFRPEAVARALGGNIPIFATSVFPNGGQITLPQEEFALTALPPGDHQGVVVQALDADLTVMIPAGTALLLANVQRGGVLVQDYRNGNFVLLLHNGPMRLRNVGGAGYAQVARGPLMIRDSSFDRIRARTAIGNILFEGCSSRQIQVSSVNGTIVYDNGSFQPGLARFESENGNVAIGVPRNGAQIGAHSSVGRIYSLLGGSVRAGQTDAQLGAGRAIVTASSSHGSVLLYNGTLRAQRSLPPEWRPLATGLAPRGGAGKRRIH